MSVFSYCAPCHIFTIDFRREGSVTANLPASNLIRHLFTKGQPVTYAKNEVILGNDIEPDGVYLISSGYIKVYTISDEGDELLHVIYGKGELFPLIWAYTGDEPRSIFYETISESTVWRIPRNRLMQAISTDINLCIALSIQLARQFRVHADRLENLEYKKASQRVAYRILFLASRFGVKTDNTIVLDAPISHEAFANSINLARESVSREIEKLEDANIIAKNSRHRLVIKDVGALSRRLSEPVGFASWHLT